MKNEDEIEIPIETDYRDILKFLGIKEDGNGISNNTGIPNVSAAIPTAISGQTGTTAEPV